MHEEFCVSFVVKMLNIGIKQSILVYKNSDYLL